MFPGKIEEKNLYFYSINMVNWSNKKLVTLATCYSAGKDVADNNLFSCEIDVILLYDKCEFFTFP